MDRIKKLAIDIKREISFIINTKIKDPRIGFITITDTRLSADGKYLDIYFSTMEKGSKSGPGPPMGPRVRPT